MPVAMRRGAVSSSKRETSALSAVCDATVAFLCKGRSGLLPVGRSPAGWDLWDRSRARGGRRVSGLLRETLVRQRGATAICITGL
jgi:hypothetical protein